MYGKEDIRTINPDSLILLLIVSLGFLIFTGSLNKSSENSKDSNSIEEVAIIHKSAILYTPSQFQVVQMSWLSGMDNLLQFSFYRNPLFEDKKVNQKIFLLNNIRDKSVRVSVYIIRNHLFSGRDEEIPPIS
jgi:hypothetical protein